MSHVVIPDSIEPYVGWKALRITKDGLLQSPLQCFNWPVGVRTVAVCLRSGVGVYHHSGNRTCTCGIYVVETEGQTIPYLHPDCVLCKVALWGQVTIADRGARGQYAYPQVMYVPEHLMNVAPLVADLYEIPLEAMQQEHPVLKAHYVKIGHEVAQKKKMKRMKVEQERRDARGAFWVFILASILVLASWYGSFLRYGLLCSIGPLILASLTTVIALIALIDSKRPIPEA